MKLHPQFIAHRGYANAYPENTIAAVEAACIAGASFIEVDVQLSKDHVAVLFHDRDLQRLCKSSGAVHDYTLQQLEQLYVNDTEKFPDSKQYKIATLNEFIDFLLQHENLFAFIELKRVSIEKWGIAKFLEVIFPLFNGLKQRICFISFDKNILETINSTSDFSTGIVVDNYEELAPDDMTSYDWCFCDLEGLPEENIPDEVKQQLVVYEVGSINQAEQLISKGIRYLETFNIKELLTFFKNT